MIPHRNNQLSVSVISGTQVHQQQLKMNRKAENINKLIVKREHIVMRKKDDT
jgi:hypothetical protein